MSLEQNETTTYYSYDFSTDDITIACFAGVCKEKKLLGMVHSIYSHLSKSPAFRLGDHVYLVLRGKPGDLFNGHTKIMWQPSKSEAISTIYILDKETTTLQIEEDELLENCGKHPGRIERLPVALRELTRAGSWEPVPGPIDAEVASLLDSRPRQEGDEPMLPTDTQNISIPTEDVIRDISPCEGENAEGFLEKYKKITKRHGAPFKTNKKDEVTSVLQPFWAGLNCQEHDQLFEPTEKAFYRYCPDTGLFKELTKAYLKEDISQRMFRVAGEHGISGLDEKRTDATLSSIVRQMEGICERRDAFEVKKNYIHLKNCILEINDSHDVEVRPFSPTYRSRNQSPIAYDPEATCSRFKNDLLLPMMSAQDAVIVQKYAGLCILGDNRIQRFVIFDGDAGCGKSQLSIVFQMLVGPENVTEMRTQHLDGRFEINRYLKKTLLVGVDVPANFLMQRGANRLKALTGGDPLDTERKGSSKSFKIRGDYCVIMTSNSRLHVRLEGDMGAWHRRLLMVGCHARGKRKNIPDFAKKLIAEEGSGILNWALEGLKMILDEIDEHGGLVVPNEQERRIDALLAESDSFRHFIKTKIVSIPNEDRLLYTERGLTVSEITEEYAEYCRRQGWRPKPHNLVRRELPDLIFELFGKTKSNDILRSGKNQRGFHDIVFLG